MPKKAQIRPSEREAVAAQLEETIGRFGSLQQMTEELRRHPQFADLTRSTIFRWKTHPAKRTKTALAILNATRVVEMRTVPFAIVDSILSLAPLELVSRDNSHKRSFYKRFGAYLENVECENGGQARELLRSRSVDFAVFSPHRGMDDRGLVRLCNLSSAPLVGIAHRSVGTVADLGGLNLGTPENTVVANTIYELLRRFDVLPKGMNQMPMDKLSEFLLEGEDRAVVTWEPKLSELEATVAAEGAKTTMRMGNLLPRLDLDLWTHPSVSPDVVRNLLTALTEESRHIENSKRTQLFIKRLSEEMSIDLKHIRAALDSTQYYWPACELARLMPLVEIWEREVSKLITSEKLVAEP